MSKAYRYRQLYLLFFLLFQMDGLFCSSETLIKKSFSSLALSLCIFSPLLCVWQGYLPANKERRELVLKRKREEYFGFIEQYYHSRTDEHYKDTYRQVYVYS